MDYSSSVIEIDITDHIATLWLNRPDRHNAINNEVWLELPRAIQAIEAEEDVRAVILAGRGKSFTAGLDLASLQQDMAPNTATAAGCLKQLEMTQMCQKGVSAIADCSLPVISATHGFCLGAGVDLITACDIRLTAKDVVFGVRETKIAIVADVGTLQRLPKIINPGHVADLVYTGRDFDAAHAENIGLVTGVYDDFEATYAAAQKIASQIAVNSPLAVKGSKFILQQSEDMTTEQSLLLNGLWTMTTTLNSNDIKEAMMAFAQKRPAKFTGS